MLIEIDARCNLDCKSCPRKTRKGEIGAMTLELFRECIDKVVVSDLDKFVFAAGFGESMLNRDFVLMIKYAKEKGCRVFLPTNATKINDENIPYLRLIDALQLSIDSLRDEERRTQDPNDVLSLIPKLQSYGIHLWLNITLGKSNWNEISDFIQFGLSNNIIINFITPRPLHLPDEFLESEMKFVAKNSAFLKRLIKPYSEIFFDDSCRTFQNCKVMNYDFAIAWNGDMYPCSAAFFQDYKFGNICDFQNLDDFWKTKEMMDVGKGKHPVCNLCKEYDKIWNNAINESDDRKAIAQLENQHREKSCFVITSGQSFTREIADNLADEITIGVNDVVKAQDIYGFTPNYLCFSDCNVFLDTEYIKDIKKSNASLIISEFIFYHALMMGKGNELERVLSELENKISFVPWINDEYLMQYILRDAGKLSFDLHKGTYICGSVIQDLAIPLAVWMGCNEINLVGCDCDGGSFLTSKIAEGFNRFPTNQYRYFVERLQECNIQIFNISNSNIPQVEKRTNV